MSNVYQYDNITFGAGDLNSWLRMNNFLYASSIERLGDEFDDDFRGYSMVVYLNRRLNAEQECELRCLVDSLEKASDLSSKSLKDVEKISEIPGR